MDRHVKWLRRRIIASVATQTAETFAVVAVLAFAVMQWRTDEGPLTALFGSVVVAQLVAGARIGHAMRNNPLNYVFMRRYVDQPFTYRVTRFQGEEQAHPVAERLPGFAPVATIRDHDADPEPVFDVYHDPSRLVAASVSRASGSVSLVSSLNDGRILVTDARSMPPHERLVMNLAEDDSVDSVIATHRRAISARSDIAELASSAHQVVLDSLAVEYDSYLALGPTLSPFLDLEPAGRSWLRLIARIKPEELSELPVRLGPHLSTSDARVPALAATPAPAAIPVAAPATPSAHPAAPTELNVPQVIAPPITAPQMVSAEIVAPIVAGIMPAAANVLVGETAVDGVPVVVAPTPAELEAPAPVAEIAPHAFVTVEPDAADFAIECEPITTEVPAVVFTQEAAAHEDPGFVASDAAITETTAAALTQAPAAEVPLDLAAAIASMATVPTIDVVEAPAPPVVAEPALPVAVEPVPLAPAPPVVAEPVPLAPAEPVVAEPAVVEPVYLAPAPPVVAEPALPAVVEPVYLAPEPPVVAEPALPAVAGPVYLAPAPPVVAEPAVVEPVYLAPAPPVVAEPAVVEPVYLAPAEPVVAEPAVVEPVYLAPAEPVVAEPAVVEPVYLAPAPPVVAEPVPVAFVASEPVHAPLPDFIMQPPAASLAEAVQPAPDTAAALTETGGPWSAPSEHVSDVDPVLVPNLDVALGRTEELSPTRPRLSAVLRANAGQGGGASGGRRSRRKSR